MWVQDDSVVWRMAEVIAESVDGNSYTVLSRDGKVEHEVSQRRKYFDALMKVEEVMFEWVSYSFRTLTIGNAWTGLFQVATPRFKSVFLFTSFQTSDSRSAPVVLFV